MLGIYLSSIDYCICSIHVIRWKRLQQNMDDRYHTLKKLEEEGIPQVHAMLSKSVDPPWERSISENQVPYYIK